jgi:hypothetical protein
MRAGRFPSKAEIEERADIKEICDRLDAEDRARKAKQTSRAHRFKVVRSD